MSPPDTLLLEVQLVEAAKKFAPSTKGLVCYPRFERLRQVALDTKSLSRFHLVDQTGFV